MEYFVGITGKFKPGLPYTGVCRMKSLMAQHNDHKENTEAEL